MDGNCECHKRITFLSVYGRIEPSGKNIAKVRGGAALRFRIFLDCPKNILRQDEFRFLKKQGLPKLFLRFEEFSFGWSFIGRGGTGKL